MKVTQWWSSLLEHQHEVEKRSRAHQDRRKAGRAHPIEDFLWDYYSLRPKRLAVWHPGAGVCLERPPTDHPAEKEYAERLTWRWHVETDNGLTLDVDAFANDRANGITFMTNVSEAIASRPPFFGCFGWHEWCMVYRGDKRHPVPLRLGQAGTDEVVERAHVACTHFDAFRFFTDDARPLNSIDLSRETTLDNEQGGCLHANMDLLGWCSKLGPAIPSSLLLDCFDLAMEIRYMDMAAAPYDLDIEPIRIETAAGRAEYVRRQKNFAERAAALRSRLLEILVPLRARLS